MPTTRSRQFSPTTTTTIKMKYSIAALGLIATLAVAQLPNIPICSQACFLTALSTDGCTSITDFKCHCSKTGLTAQIVPCINAACSAADAAGM